MESCLGFGLKGFLAARPPKARAEGQKRYLVPASALPESLGARGGHELRSCICDTRTGDRFLEA